MAAERFERLSDDDRRTITGWCADCAERVLPIFERVAPSDARPREAIQAARDFAAGGQRNKRLRDVAWGALRAGREVEDAAAAAAARAACSAAGMPYFHDDIRTAGQARHVLGPAAQAALAAELDAGGDATVGDAEIRWAVDHAQPVVAALIRRMAEARASRTRSGSLYAELDSALRRGSG